MTLKEILLKIKTGEYKEIAMHTAIEHLNKFSNVQDQEVVETIQNWKTFIQKELKEPSFDEEIINIKVPI